MTWLGSALAAFIPVFVAMDIFGLLPTYVNLVGSADLSRRRRVLKQAILTAGVAGLLFIFLGKAVFAFLGVTVSDFKVAGGLILVILAVEDLLFADKARQPSTSETLGVVPLGLPLIVGPAVLTSLLIQMDLQGISATVAAFVVNLVIAFVTLRSADAIMRVVGKAGTQAISKVASLLLAAIGVMMIRIGLFEMLK